MIHTRLLTAASALAAALAGPACAEDTQSVWRVFVGDHAAPRITAFDLADPDTRWTFDTKGQAKLYSAANGAAVVAVQSDDDQVNLIRSGVRLVSHGDHSDLSVSDPSAMDAVLTGPRPFHVVTHGGTTSIQYDKGGYAEFLSDAALAEGTVTPTRFPQARAHHGFALPFGDLFLSSVASDAPVEGDAAPPRLGLQAFAADGTAAGDLATCTGIHGEALSGAYLAAGCKEGVLTVREGEAPEFNLLPYPADWPEGTTGTLLGARAMQVFVGNYGADGVVVVDPEDEPHFKFVKLPFRRVDFVLDPAAPQFAYVLTEDGTLHRLNVLKAALEDGGRVTGPYPMDGHWNDPRPRLAVADGQILVTDPAAGMVHVVAGDTLKVTQDIAVGGTPYNLVAVGGSGMQH
ncbi:hypothetical protein [Falsirhodobacter sp. 20TX0035]|uniref:hypothetical protein n=1 Tax=Falsirhodobacter sp. 20TX0035 TaxID=3022019 RepID=UPI00232D8353|nr:hypothetical protein [Falsirhodobacter sp. 20TX0035]MDB6454491.1 hypothetical protein [Falsirhodobacter sp. 20TX0035]